MSHSTQTQSFRLPEPPIRHLDRPIGELKEGRPVSMPVTQYDEFRGADTRFFMGYAFLKVNGSQIVNGTERELVRPCAIFQSAAPCVFSTTGRNSFADLAKTYRTLYGFTTQPVLGDTPETYTAGIKAQLGFSGEHYITGDMIPLLDSFTEAVHIPYEDGKPFYPVRVMVMGPVSPVGLDFSSTP